MSYHRIVDGNETFYYLMADYHASYYFYWCDMQSTLRRYNRLDPQWLLNEIKYHKEMCAYYTNGALDNCPPERIAKDG